MMNYINLKMKNEINGGGIHDSIFQAITYIKTIIESEVNPFKYEILKKLLIEVENVSNEKKAEINESIKNILNTIIDKYDEKRNIILMLILAIFILSSIRKYFRYKYNIGYSKYGLRR